MAAKKTGFWLIKDTSGNLGIVKGSGTEKLAGPTAAGSVFLGSSQAQVQSALTATGGAMTSVQQKITQIGANNIFETDASAVAQAAAQNGAVWNPRQGIQPTGDLIKLATVVAGGGGLAGTAIRSLASDVGITLEEGDPVGGTTKEPATTPEDPTDDNQDPAKDDNNDPAKPKLPTAAPTTLLALIEKYALRALEVIAGGLLLLLGLHALTGGSGNPVTVVTNGAKSVGKAASVVG